MDPAKLHVISFDIPYPANYGGVMDVFYKVKALHEMGVGVILHCFQYGLREPSEVLAQYCNRVYYYPRDRSLKAQFSVDPFNVRSRDHKDVLKNLLKDHYPILFEGLHCCGLIGNKNLKGRFKAIRMHNVEWRYYRNLSKLEGHFFKKAYFKIESRKFLRYEKKVVRHADALFAISHKDFQYFSRSEKRCVYVPPFHPNERVEIQQKISDYALFQGKLSVVDNELAAIYLIEKVLDDMEIPFVVAGAAPTQRLLDAAKKYPYVKIVADPSEKEMNALISGAQLNLVVSFQQAGMKLKLLNALFKGKFCIVNPVAVADTGLKSLCIVARTPKEMKEAVESAMNLQFSDHLIKLRKEILEMAFSNKINAAVMAEVLGFI